MASYFATNISVKRLTKGKLPRLPFSRLKESMLGKKYELSIVFAGREVAQRLNKRYRGKNQPTNILSFALSEKTGELVISLEQARKEAPQFKKSYLDFLGSLLIHGLLHLKGYKHGKKMETEERRFIKKFNF